MSDHRTGVTRRSALRVLALGVSAPFLAAQASAAPATPPIPIPPAPFPVPPLPPSPAGPLNFRSPALEPFVDALPVPPVQPAGGVLTATSGTHRYHRDLPETRSWGYSRPVHGPVLEARSGEPSTVTFRNELGAHVLAPHVDTTLHGTSERDRTDPRMCVHLHGGPSHPASEGHPLVTWRGGGEVTNEYGNRQEAATLWYHDHAMGITRLNVHAGLCGVYYVRDAFDTGRPDNPLGLPAGDYEIPLTIQDRTFNADGTLQPRYLTVIPEGFNQMGQFGDVACVNAAAWPYLDVRRTVYRFRLLQASNSRTYRLEFANRMPFHVVGNDQGLLDAPVETTWIRLVPGERADILVDFRALADGEKVELVNTELNTAGNAVFMVPELRRIMQFRAAGDGPPAQVPARLRGGPGQPAPLGPLTTPTRTRTMTMLALADPARRDAVAPAMTVLNNLPFLSDDVDTVQSGTVEQWDIANVTAVDHPVHLHLARFRVIGRQPFRAAAYLAANPVPALGVRWAPPTGPFVFGEHEAPEPWEAGWKDTVHCPPDMVTRLLVHWPSRDDLGFDPDAPIPVPPGAEVAHGSGGHGAHGGHGSPGDHSGHRVPAHGEGDPPVIRGYVWHCHNLDHEDHDMMQQLRVLG